MTNDDNSNNNNDDASSHGGDQTQPWAEAVIPLVK